MNIFILISGYRKKEEGVKNVAYTFENSYVNSPISNNNCG
jgi:hypothetical protein